MILALGGGWAKQNNGVSHFFAWGLFCGVSGANTTKQTWQTDN
jgi:nitrate/nitrite transporter NarK